MAHSTPEPAGQPAGDLVPADRQIARRLTWPEKSAEPKPIPEHLLAQLLDAVEQIPAEEGAGVEGILEQLLEATSLDELNRPWDGTSGKTLAGKRLAIRSMIRRPSQFDDGPQIFLVVHSADAKTGEPVTWTTSALAVIVQLAMAWKLGFFPIIAEVVVAERPTERGYYPYHLNVIAAGNTGQAAGPRE